MTTRGLVTAYTDALAAAGITTAWMARMEFASGTLFGWTGIDAITPTGTGDTLLDGNTFQALTPSAMVSWGDNVIAYGGSEPLALSLAIPSAPPTALANAAVDPNEYQGRLFVLWRAIMTAAPGIGSSASWLFTRVRAGLMDGLTVTNSGDAHLFQLTVESHQAAVTGAAGRTYQSTKAITPGDTAADFMTNIANGSPHPARNTQVNTSPTLPFGFRIPGFR